MKENNVSDDATTNAMTVIVTKTCRKAIRLMAKMGMSNPSTCMIDMNMALQNPQLNIDQN